MANSIDSVKQIPQHEMDEWKEVLARDGVKGYELFLRTKTKQWKSIPLNIGVIGSSDAGKSSFINAIRDLEGDDDGAAPVGVTEQTKVPTPYCHPNNAMMQLWDLPGVGTQSFPKESYLKKIGFKEFDFFLVLASVRFTELDAWLSQDITNKGKQFFFVRTKIQSDIENDRKAHPKKYKSRSMIIVDEIIHQIRTNLQENLNHLYQAEKVFLIDSYEKGKYDYALLERRLVEDFPELKRQAFIFSMNAFSERMVLAKVTELRLTVPIYAILSATIAAVSVLGLSFAADLGIVAYASKFYFDQLGLTERSLDRMANVTNTYSLVLKNIVAAHLDTHKFLTVERIKELCVPCQ